MKKLFILLTMLIVGIGSMWADGLKVSTTESSSAEYQYKIFCRAASSYYLGNTTNATNSGTDYGLFAFFKDDSGDYENGYYIYSIFAEKWVTYTAGESYGDGQNKISLVSEKPSVPWNIAADDSDNKYYDIRPFKTDKTVANMSWNWHGGAAANTSNTMGFYGYTDSNSGWGIVLAGGSGSPVADRKVVAIYNRNPSGSEYPITSSVNSAGKVLSSNSTTATPQLFVLKQNGIDVNGEALYNLQKAEGDGKYFSNDYSTPNANTYSETSSNFVFLNTSSSFISNYNAILKEGTTIATSNYNFMARGTYYGCIHSKNDGTVFDGWTSNANSGYKIQFYYNNSSWNGLWSVKEQSYTAWQVVITGASESGSVTYKGSSLLSGATATQSNNGIFVISSVSTPTSSDFTINNVDGYLTDPTISFDSNRKLIKVAYTEYASIRSTIVNFLANTPETIGYPTSAARATLQAAIDAFDASSKVTSDLITLNTAYTTFQSTTDVNLPDLGKIYTIQNYIKSPSKTTYLKNENGTLTIGTDASETALNNLWIVRKSGNTYVLQSAADLTKYIVYTSFTLAASGSTWTFSQGTEWPYISMYNSSLGDNNGRYVACNGSDQFGTAGGSAYYASDRTQSTANGGWSTDFKFVESPDFALYKVKIICPKGKNPTVTYSGTVYSNGADFVASTTLTTSDLTVSTIEGYTSNVSIDGDVIYVNYNVTLNNTYADAWDFDASPWLLLNDVPDDIANPDRTYRYNSKRINLATTYKSVMKITFNYIPNSGNYRIDVAGVDLLDASTGNVVYHDYHDGYSGTAQSNNEYTLNNVAPGNYILRYISYSQSTSSKGNITVNVIPNDGVYRIKAGVSNKYITGNTSSYQSFLALSSSADNSTIIYYVNGKLLNYSKGLYSRRASEQATVEQEGDSYTVNPSANRSNYYTVYSTTLNNYIYDSGNTSGRGCVDRQESLGGNNTDWQFEEVSSLPLELAANSYTSFSAPVPITIPEDNGEEKADYYAYYATSQDIDAGVINMKRVTGNIPANTGLIIYTKVANPEIQIAASGTELKNTNLLQPNVAASNVSTEGNYFFGKVGSSYIFTKLTGSDTYTLPGHKAYLQLSSSPSRLSLSWDYNESTGIHELNDEIIKLTDGKYYQNNQVVIVRNGVKYNVAGQKIK